MEISIKWNICRVCLKEETHKENEKMIPIFEEHEGNKKLAKDIFDSSGIAMSPNDGLPDKICRKCVAILKQAVYFRKTCRESNTNLRSVLEQTKSATNFFKKDRSKDIVTVSESDDNICDEDAELEDEEIVSEAKEVIAEEEKRYLHKKRKECGNKRKIEPERNCDEKRIKNEQKFVESDFSTKNEKQVMSVEDEVINEPLDFFTNAMDETPKVPSGTSALGHTIDLATGDNVSSENPDLDANSTSFSSKMLKVQEMIDSETFENDFTVDSAPEGDCRDNSIKKANESLYYIISNDGLQEDINSNEPANMKNNQLSEENISYVSFSEERNEEDNDEELLEEFDEDSQDNDDEDDNVTSTVITKEDVYFESAYSTNSEQNIDIEYEIDEFIIHEPSKISKNSNVTLNYEHKAPLRIHQSKKTTSGKVKSQSSTSPLTCEICGNSFNSRQVLNVHMKIHRQEKTHECEICFKRFITACNLQAHMRVHTGEKPFECKFCARRFSDRSTHIRHERIHTNEKPFTCDDCGKSFALATTLQAHLKVHTGERPFRCEPCSKSFKLAHQLKAHKNTSLHKAVENSAKHSKYIDA